MPVVRLSILQLHEHGMPLGSLEKREGKHLGEDPGIKRAGSDEGGGGIAGVRPVGGGAAAAAARGGSGSKTQIGRAHV